VLIDAQLKQQQVAALLSVFLSDPSGSVSLGEVFDRDKVQLTPAAVRLVPPDTTVTAINPPEARGGIDLTKHLLRSIAAGCGLPAWKVSADLSDVNFSSARMGDFAWRRRAGALQKLIEGQFLNPAFRRFVALEVGAGRLAVSLDNLDDPSWIWPAPAQIDPLAETQADQLAVQAGFVSRQSVISKLGRDPEEVQNEIEADTFTPAAPPTPAQPQLKVVPNA
jgi:capsid protein